MSQWLSGVASTGRICFGHARRHIAESVNRGTVHASSHQRAYLSSWSPPTFVNEPVATYAKGSAEREQVTKAITDLSASFPEKIPITAGGRTLNDNYTLNQVNPSRHAQIVAQYADATPDDVNACIDAALAAKPAWEALPFEDRAGVFLRAAELMVGKYKSKVVATTMLGQGKNVYQSEIDAAAETVDFIRYYVQEAYRLYATQPEVHTSGTWNRLEYRPLEGFIYSIAPFNFTALFGTLVVPAVLLGNVVVWKPSPSAVQSAWLIYQILLEAGLPADVVKFVPGDAERITDTVLARPEFAGVSYIGSTAVFKELFGKIGQKTAAETYRSYPRIVGETGGKNFHLVHSSADIQHAALNTIRGSFEYAGQKCSATSRAYVAESVWPEFKKILIDELEKVKVGDVEDFSNYINPVIHERAFDRLNGVIDQAKHDPELTLIAGGQASKEEGYFVTPTVYQTSNPKHEYMQREFFGPVLTIYVYPDAEWNSVPGLIDSTSTYALTGAVFARDPSALRFATDALKHSAGMFYVNTKSTGSMVAQQPFGGSRDSGSNDKSGTMALLQRWTSARTVKEEFNVLDTLTYPSNEV